MKKVLLATTILALSAPLALAEVTVGGTGRMGVTYDEANVDNELAFTSRIRIIFTASGETDGGLSFGGTIRADNAADGNEGTAGNVFISGAFGKITMGDVDGAAELVTGDLHGVGLTGLGDTNENFFFSNGGIAGLANDGLGLPATGVFTADCVEIDPATREAFCPVTTVDGVATRPTARYEYSTGGLTFAMSIDNPGNDAAGGLENVYSVGVKYAVDAYSVGLGYETAKVGGVSIDHVIAAATATFSGVEVKATYGAAKENELDIDFAQYGLSASYEMDALGLSAFYRVEDDASVKTKFVGIGASYDLGGGASVVGGIAQSKTDGESSNTLADLGVSFTF